MEAPDEIWATFLEDELQDPIRVEEVTEVRLVPVGLRAGQPGIVLFISKTLISWWMFNWWRYLSAGVGTLGDGTCGCSRPIHILRKNFGDKEVLALGEVIRDHLPEGHGKDGIIVVQSKTFNGKSIVIDQLDLGLIAWERLVLRLDLGGGGRPGFCFWFFHKVKF